MSIPLALEYPLEPEVADYLYMLVTAALVTPQQNIFEIAGGTIIHPSLPEATRFYDGYFIALREAGMVQAFSGNFEDLRIAVTKRGFNYIEEVNA